MRTGTSSGDRATAAGPATASRAALITGCSTGIGRATALRLAAHGWPVHATARRLEDIADLAAHGCRTLRLDLGDADSLRAAVAAVEREHGAVGVLINNAGVGLPGAVEAIDLDRMRREFETNLFGPTHLTQLVLPGMRRQGRGRIVNVSSVGGRITTPGNGAYHASKHALEALSDALRFEVRGFGIDVILIEPGSIRTRWAATAVAGLEDGIDRSGPYARFERAVGALLRRSDTGLLALAAGRPDDVARAIARAVAARRPRTRYTVPPLAALFTLCHRWLPDRAWDAVMRRIYPSPG